MDTKDIAAVMVTADLPAFAAAGSRTDVTVSAMGDAKSLLGGTLMVTPLLGYRRSGLYGGAGHGADRFGLRVGRFGLVGDRSACRRRGRIASGGTVEREVAFQLDQMPIVRLTLHNPDFTTSAPHRRRDQRPLSGVGRSRRTPRWSR